jgi:hypothetical protein
MAKYDQAQPTWNSIYLVSLWLLWPISLAQLWTRPCDTTQLWKKYLNFEINFQWYKLLKIQYLPHLKSKKYKITSKKFHSSKCFQQYKTFAPISLKYIVVWFFGIFWKKCLIFHNFCIVGLNNAKPPWCTPYSSKAFTWWGALWFGRSQHDKQRKLTNYLPL